MIQNTLLKRTAQTFAIAILAMALLVLAKTAQAAVRCETQYGGGQTCVKTGELQIDKEVWSPQENKFVDNLGITSHKFNPTDEIIFKLKIKNVGDARFDKVSISDTLPSLLERVSGDLTFEISELDPGEEVEREIKARVVSSSQFPNDKTVLCVLNTAEVWTGDEKDKDTAQVCLERKVLGAVIQPATGPEDWLLTLSAVALAGIAGLSLKRFIKTI